MGKQVWGVCLNLTGQFGIGLPLALLMGFVLGWSVEGLLGGLTIGVALQAAAYLVIMHITDWQAMAAAISAAHSHSEPAESEAA